MEYLTAKKELMYAQTESPTESQTESLTESQTESQTECQTVAPSAVTTEPRTKTLCIIKISIHS